MTSGYKICIGMGVGFKIRVEDEMRIARNAGYDAVFTGWERGRLRDWVECAAQNGLEYQSVHAPFHRMKEIWEGGTGGEEAVGELIECVGECAAAKVPLVIVHAFIGFDDHTPTAKGIERIGRLVEESERTGVKLAFENVEGEEYLTAVMDAYGSLPNVGFCWDTGHQMCYNRSQDVVSLWGEKLFGTHFNDNLGITDPERIFWTDDLHLLPFDGKADWRGIMKELKEKNFSGPLTFELTVCNKPDKHYHDKYAALGAEGFYAEAYRRAEKIAALEPKTGIQ